MVSEIKLLTIVVMLCSLTSCTSYSVTTVYSNTPNHVPKSAFYSKYRTGLSATEVASGTKVGVSHSECFFGAVSLGDASIYRAASHGRITQISYVDQEVYSVTFFPLSPWSIYEEYRTIVVGK